MNMPAQMTAPHAEIIHWDPKGFQVGAIETSMGRLFFCVHGGNAFPRRQHIADALRDGIRATDRTNLQ